jgi:hypothetical protein
MLLFATATVAQEPQAAAHRDLWCGLAFQYAAGQDPVDTTPRHQRVIPSYITGAEMLLERAESSYRQAGYSPARLAALREALQAEIAAGLDTPEVPYSFQDCKLLLPR